MTDRTLRASIGHPPRRVAVLLFAGIVAAFGCSDRPSPDGDAAAGDAVQPATLAPQYGDDPIANGRLSYETYCASCHGATGNGDGPVAPALTTPPTDLTQLAATSGGTYPAERIVAFIDGRSLVQAHGTREMPVWGNVWSEQDGVPVRQEVVAQRINELVEYLRTIQAPANR